MEKKSKRRQRLELGTLNLLWSEGFPQMWKISALAWMTLQDLRGSGDRIQNLRSFQIGVPHKAGFLTPWRLQGKFSWHWEEQEVENKAPLRKCNLKLKLVPAQTRNTNPHPEWCKPSSQELGLNGLELGACQIRLQILLGEIYPHLSFSCNPLHLR